MNTLTVDGNSFFPVTETEKMLETKVRNFEEKFLAFGKNTLLPLIARLPEANSQQVGMKMALRYPFETVERNMANPLRNMEVVRRMANAQGVLWQEITLGSPNPHFFSYDRLTNISPQQKDVGVAGFAPVGRVMVFGDDLDFSREIDHFIVFHECHHVAQFAPRYSHELKWVTSFWQSEIPRVIVNDEYQAYGLEIEAINLLVNGSIRQRIQSGKEVDPSWLMAKLHSEEEITRRLIRLMHAYYPEGNAAIGKYPTTYRSLVQGMCLQDGYDIYEAQGANLVRLVLK